MLITPSPIRYTGGTVKLFPFVRKLLLLNECCERYIEPFAGGAGLALKLLFSGIVKEIVINDSDFAIYSFWKSVLFNSDELCDFIESIPLNYEEWQRQRSVYMLKDKANTLDLGKAVLYLNRTNVSGIIKGGVVGGKNQLGNYKMDARFNRSELIKKITAIAEMASYIHLYNFDVFDLLEMSSLRCGKRDFVMFDPPYVKQGNRLYMNFFSERDHVLLRDAIGKYNGNWIVTYDESPLIMTLYKRFRGGSINTVYCSNRPKKARELIFYSENLQIPTD